MLVFHHQQLRIARDSEIYRHIQRGLYGNEPVENARFSDECPTPLEKITSKVIKLTKYATTYYDVNINFAVFLDRGKANGSNDLARTLHRHSIQSLAPFHILIGTLSGC